MTKSKNTFPLSTSWCPALIILLLASVSASAADEDVSLQSISPGMRVRILAPDLPSGKVIGAVERVTADTVTVVVPGRSEPVSVLREKIARLDVSEGARSRGVDATIGGFLGAGLAAAGCALANGSGRGQIVSTGGVAAFCALVGSGIGAIIGVAIPPGERWKEVSAARYRISFVPRLDHGADLAVAWRF